MKKPKKTRVKFIGPCSYDGCRRAAKVEFGCITCEKSGKTFKLKACRLHVEPVQKSIRRHALIKHPGNLLGAMAAQLKGEDVF